MNSSETKTTMLDGVAIIGMAGRFPGARSVAEFWRNQLQGIESISHFSVEELEVPSPQALVQDPNYVCARSVLDEVDLFDAEFFGILPREAELMDPQQRLFLECCWQAFEDGGYEPSSYPGAIGVFAGSSVSTYFLSRLCANPDFIRRYTSAYQVGNYAEMMGNNQDFLSTRVSYKLNLRGPSFTMLAGCSTSLVAVCQACQSLLTYQSDMALAGGSSITFPQKRGSVYQDGGMVSPDGHCRTFDAAARGTVFGSGVAVVLLKRLEDAARDGDQIYAIIRGYAVNNDGAAKVGYTAPGVEGQARAIVLAQEAAGVDPESIGYIEAHGTGTPLGDPIELAALTDAFRSRTEKKHFCVIGTAKTNVGHLDIAAGVTGLIHAAHVVRDGKFPPTLHYKAPNPKFDLASSPFYVQASAAEWVEEHRPRRAGVSAFGVGGTNAHVIIEQSPEKTSEPAARPLQILMLSARSQSALEQATENLEKHLEAHPEINLADAAWTLAAGRRSFACRRSVVARDVPDALSALRERGRKQVQTRLRPLEKPLVNFLFPGQGSQHANMGKEIYQTEEVFRRTVDQCAEILKPDLGADLRALLYPSEQACDRDKRRVTDTIIAQPAIFTVEYALAQLWMSWGIRPQAMLGHSIGEFVAACLAGVFSLEDALRLVAARGRMMQELPAGGMLSVRLPESEINKRLNGHLSLAAVNAPSLSVVSGPFDALEEFERGLAQEGTACRRLVTSHAFHSAMMDPVIEPFTARVAQLQLSPPQIPYISCVSGTWVSDEEATSPEYWARHFRQPVQFSRGVAELRKNASTVLLEVGPGNVLTTLARQHTGSADQSIVSSLSDGFSGEGDALSLMNALATLWLAGAQPDWKSFYGPMQRQRVSLPTYPFERKRYWLEAPSLEARATVQESGVQTSPEPSIDRTTSLEGCSPVRRKTESVAPEAEVRSRATRIRSMLVEIFEELSGLDLSSVEGSSTFLEMGCDSLFLTQVAQSLHNKFGLKITFRQLLVDQSSLIALAEYVDSKLPPDVFIEPDAPLMPSSSAVPVATSSAAVVLDPATPAGTQNGDKAMAESSLERLMREQLQAMNQLFAKQLETVCAVSPDAASAAASVPAAAPSVRLAVPAAPVAKAQEASSSPDREVKELKGFTPFSALPKAKSGELTPAQQKHIAELVDRYTAKTSTSKRKTQEYRSVLADPRVVAGFRSEWKEMVYPIITVRSKGSQLWDIDGNEYVDLLNGFGPIMLGHRPDFVEKAIEKQLHEGFEIGPQTLLAGEVAKTICEFTGNERATFCNTGSEAVTAAMRVARTVTGRNKIVFFAGDYHGMFDEVLVKGFKKAGVPQAVPVAPGIPREKVANVVVLEYGSAESLAWIRQNAQDLAAVMVEPVQSRHPNLQPIEFLKEIRKITEDSGACLIFDEVVTGFRVHPGGCQALFGIRADLATYGKVLAGGMPIGVLAGKAKYMDALDGGMWQFGDNSYPEVGVTFFAGTFVRHPLTLAAVKAVLEHFKEQGSELQQGLSERAGKLARRLNEIIETNGVPTRVENFASIFYFSFPSDFRFGSLFYYHLREKGIHLLEGFPCFLTTAHTDADIERIVQAFRETVAEMQRGELLPLPVAEVPVVKTVPQSEAEALTASTQPVTAPVTEPQLEVWLSDQLNEDASCSYNESFTLHMRGAVNEKALREALRALIGRHDALRATFDAEGKTLRIAPKLDLEIPIVDLTALMAAERQARLEQTIREDAHTPFNLQQGPLVRVRLVKMEPHYQLLIFTSHHIICDGWSTNVLLEELAKLYNGALQGVAADLPVPMSFVEYASCQSNFLSSAEGAEVEAYWLERFRTPAPLLDLPTDRLRPSTKEYKGATYRSRINRENYNNIKKLGARQKCTLFVTLLAAFEILLHRLSGQEDIVVGVPTAGQSLLDDAVLVGHCVNFIPLRGHVAGKAPVEEFLAQMKQVVLDGYDHQNYTYGRLVRKLSLQRDPSRLPLMEVQFNLERVGEDMRFDGLEAEVDANPKSFVNFDIFLNIVESKDGLVLDCDYNTGLFDESTIARWMRHYETLLASMVADTRQPVSKLDLLADVDRRKLVVDWNATEADYARETCVHELFEKQVSETPAAVAVAFEDQSLTYGELDRRVNQLANYLVKMGVKPGVLVGIFVERSLEMIVALLGVMKAGGAYVPIDPTYPIERITFVLGDAGAPILLTQEKLGQTLAATAAAIVNLDADWQVISRESADRPKLAATAEDPAYVIYTSGSTGKPKGVEIPHRAAVNLLLSMSKKPGLESKDVLVAVTTLSFDIAGLELFLPLSVGAKLVIATREAAADAGKLLAKLRASGATVMQATPVTWKMLLEAGWEGNPRLKVLCGGEAFPRELANELVRRAASVWNMYGPTETTIWSATSKVTAGEGPVVIGLPINNTQFYVLDSAGQLAAVGVAGELHIGGLGLARGYFHSPDLTAEKFIPNPFKDEPGSRLYKTGDLVRRLSDGSLVFLGRLDNQIKLRGFRIELGEIETALARYPGVREAVVLVYEDRPGDKRLVAYLATDQQALTVTAVREFLTGKLPNYMLPAAVVRLEVMPLTPNGKVDRRALPMPDQAHANREKEFVAPRNSQERTLAEIWAEVLHLERVGIHDNLFELGADSLHIFQIAARANKAGIEIAPAKFLRYRTIATLLEQMAKEATDGKQNAMPRIIPVSRDKYRVARVIQ